MEFRKKDQAQVLQETQVRLKNGAVIPVLSFPLLEQQEWLKHCFTTRMGGVSQGIFSSLNLSFTRGDEQAAVEENFRRVAEAMNAEYGNFVFSDQTHTANVRKITGADAGNGLNRPKNFFDTDGLITNVPGLVLSTFYADCVPLYFADPVHRAIGLSHSGWRGTAGRIGQVTIEALHREYGTDPKDLICAIGPSICQTCYEISEDVAMEFEKEFSGHIPEILHRKENGKYQLDLWRTNEIILEEAGVKKEHVAVTNICTCCNSRHLFSHRASHGKRGNLGAFLMIREDV